MLGPCSLDTRVWSRAALAVHLEGAEGCDGCQRREPSLVGCRSLHSVSRVAFLTKVPRGRESHPIFSAAFQERRIWRKVILSPSFWTLCPEATPAVMKTLSPPLPSVLPVPWKGAQRGRWWCLEPWESLCETMTMRKWPWLSPDRSESCRTFIRRGGWENTDIFPHWGNLWVSQSDLQKHYLRKKGAFMRQCETRSNRLKQRDNS